VAAAKQSKPKKTDAVEVKPVSTPVKHDGVVYEVGEAIEAEYRQVEHLVAAGIATLERVVTGKSGGGGSGKKDETGGAEGDGTGS